MTPELEAYRATDKLMRENLELYCRNLVRIQTKEGGALRPFIWNEAQRVLHAKLEDQLLHTGRVRAIILKARQLGISTYTAARFYHHTTLNLGRRSYILTHEDKATQQLYGMVKRIHENMPGDYQAETIAANANEFSFAGMDSGYRVGTARNTKGSGRSLTLHQFHGCLSPDTEILDGQTGALRAMREFTVGDLVRTHTGQVAPVTFISAQDKAAYRVKFKGISRPLVATPEHRFWTKDGWACLSDLRNGDMIGFPVAPISDDGKEWAFRLPDSVRPQGGGSREVGPISIAPSYELGRMLGLYLAEGTIVRQSKSKEPSAVTFTVHEREVERTVAWLGLLSLLFRSIKVAPSNSSKTVHITVYGRSFATFVHSRCGGKDTKRLPYRWSQCGEGFVLGLVHGYLSGDGHSSKSRYDRRVSATSVRSAITTGMRDALASLGYGWASIAHKPAGVRYGRVEREAWTLRLSGSGVDRLVSEIGWEMPPRLRTGNYGEVQVTGGYAWVPIAKIEDAGIVPVMDFEVGHEDHSYCALHGATHNSEVAFWERAATHLASVLEALSASPQTESILESTANGVGGTFYEQWQLAEKGQSDYTPIFLPWYIDPNYRRSLPKDFSPSIEEEDYQRIYGLDDEQLCWLHFKNIGLGGQPGKLCALLKQEYPANAAEAFQASGEDSFIAAELILAARRFEAPDQAHLPRVIGVDVARGGGDLTRFVDRQGRKAGRIDRVIDKADLVYVAGELMNTLNREGDIRRAFIDVTGLGAGVYDICRSNGFEKIVVPVNFGSQAQDPTRFVNRRAEIWWRVREWLMDPAGAELPDNDLVHRHLAAAGFKYDANSRFQLEAKDDIKKRLGASPDWGDALALTFAEHLAVELPDATPKWMRDHEAESGAFGWETA